MPLPCRLARALAPAVLVACLASAAAAGELFATLANGQGIEGDVPAGTELIRLQFPLAAGSEPRLRLTLVGALRNQPISFNQVSLFDPGGNDITATVPPENWFQRHTTGRDTVGLRGWAATASGLHELVIRTSQRTRATQAQGKLTVVRRTSLRFEGDENAPSFPIELQPGDQTSVSVKRASGTPPLVTEYRLPSGSKFTPPQKTGDRGSRSRAVLAREFGQHVYTIGYQTDDDALRTGAWKARLKLIPFRGGGPARLELRNSPGVPLSVRDADRFMNVLFGNAGVGLDFDGTFLLVTSEFQGEVRGQKFDTELAAVPSMPSAQPLTFTGDVTAPETIAGHRLVFLGTHHFLACSSASGKSLVVLKIRRDLVRDAYSALLANSPDPTTDFFLAGDGTWVSVGVYRPPDGHTVYALGVADLLPKSTVPIGGPGFPHANGAGAAWREEDSAYEFWAPDTLDYRGPSDLHARRFHSTWVEVTPQPGVYPLLVQEPGITETMPTAVSVDEATGATIVHYVVPDNPPPGAQPLGTGRIHRRLFDRTGAEIPGSHSVLPGNSRNRPVSLMLGDALYLGSDGPNGPVVERYRLLR